MRSSDWRAAGELAAENAGYRPLDGPLPYDCVVLPGDPSPLPSRVRRARERAWIEGYEAPLREAKERLANGVEVVEDLVESLLREGRLDEDGVEAAVRGAAHGDLSSSDRAVLISLCDQGGRVQRAAAALIDSLEKQGCQVYDEDEVRS